MHDMTSGYAAKRCTTGPGTGCGSRPAAALAVATCRTTEPGKQQSMSWRADREVIRSSKARGAGRIAGQPGRAWLL